MTVAVLLFVLFAVYALGVVRVIGAALNLRDLLSMQRHREAVFTVSVLTPKVPR